MLEFVHKTGDCFADDEDHIHFVKRWVDAQGNPRHHESIMTFSAALEWRAKLDAAISAVQRRRAESYLVDMRKRGSAKR